MKKHWTEHTRNLDGPIITPSRRILLDALADGPVIDDRGTATPRLYELMTKRGYTGQVFALGNLLRDAEIDGLIERVVRGKRTYAIWARQPEVDVMSSEPEPEPEPEIDLTDESEPQPEPAVDLAALAAAVLDRALSARTEVAKAEETALEALLRADEAEQRLRDLQVDAEALEAARAALRVREDQIVELKIDLEAERRRAGQAEEAANTFRTRCTELDEQVAKLRKALKNTEAELHEKNANGGYPLKSISPESHAELDRLMKQIPSRRG